ncbi:MAG: hypothetical protein WAV20_16485 [Blastocatellia bacterium]
MPEQKGQALPEALKYNLEIWWDPIPPWLVPQLDVRVLRELAVIQVELRKAVLEANLRATDKTLGALGKIK